MPPVPLPRLDVPVPADGLSIGDVAHATGLSIDTLRYYESAGLMLDPTPRDPGGRRRYTRNDLDWIAGLIMLRETGMSIADVRRMAELSREAGTEADRLVVLEGHRARVLADLARTRAHLTALEKKITSYRAAIEADTNADTNETESRGPHSPTPG
ncbi:MerR family transcriptional regulator [Herbiconiux sp. CPCC 205763]|uniref:MerR family transcriptional regulator n=1 Tax=Herbiconiux aconitum TaxID=2970913 RepID=A0ABT2GU51_9MICO|nr:MerR family transcriptional regulator [Herbiconiux aconitum]MCS5719661.1 MerR family transcriptional regulator [Herbiconiux aconitum]